jgi:cell division protein FtsN
MTQDFAKPSTTRSSSTRSSTKKTPGKRSSERSSPGKPKKQNPKHASKKAPEPQSKIKPLIVFVSIVIAAAFIVGLYLLNKVPPSKSPLTEPPSTTQTKAQKKTEPAPKIKERFNFYDILPESEIIPPKVDEYKYTEKGKPTKYQYILQTGSFRNLKDAERQRATIGFQGLKGKIEKTNNKGSTWYRVQIGPFYSRSKMNGAMDKLVAINIQPLVRQSKR